MGLRKWRPRWPALRYNHPGYFKVTLGLIICHVLYVVDGVQGVTNAQLSRVFTLLFNVMPIEAWTCLHAASAGFMILGLYYRFIFTRIGYILSVSCYWMITVAFTISFIEKPTSLYALAPTLFAALVSSAGVLEPERNPANAK